MEKVIMIRTRDGDLHVSKNKAVNHCANAAAKQFEKLLRVIRDKSYTDALTYLMEDKETRATMADALAWLQDSECMEGEEES